MIVIAILGALLLTVVCYDIGDKRRRTRVVRVLEGYGLRVQESIFECWLCPQQFRQLQAKLDSLIHRKYDRIGFYGLTPDDRRDTILLGQGSSLSSNPDSYCL